VDDQVEQVRIRNPGWSREFVLAQAADMAFKHCEAPMPDQAVTRRLAKFCEHAARDQSTRDATGPPAGPQRKRGSPQARTAWSQIHGQLSDSSNARTDDPVAARVVRELGGFTALGRAPARDLWQFERDFLDQYDRAVARTELGRSSTTEVSP